MLLKGNHKSDKSNLNTAALEKVIDKEVQHRWALTLTIDSIRHIKEGGVVLLGVS